jgi:U3 small nucleolar RNA-associated protein 25
MKLFGSISQGPSALYLLAMDDGNSVTTKLLTLLNVSATKIGKRKRIFDEFVHSEKKLNKRKPSVAFVTSDENTSAAEDAQKNIPTNKEHISTEQETVEAEEVEGILRIPLLNLN